MKRACSRSACHAGFSIVELLVAITVIAVLIALLLPSLESSRVVARTLKCASNQRQIGVALVAYCFNERDTAYPWGGSLGAQWMGDIAPFAGYTQSPYPSGAASTIKTRVERVIPIFDCPQTDQTKDSPGYDYAGDYGRNLHLMASNANPNQNTAEGAVTWPRRRRLNQIRIKPPSVIVLHADGILYNMTGFNHLTSGLPSSTIGKQRPRHHAGKVNIGFVDGHVETLAPTERNNLFWTDDKTFPGWDWVAVSVP
jgi:prepilin-type processing-associated H-X9-DG protein/prepilin-type N-terminal cleavage/methylation domain-containing protein